MGTSIEPDQTFRSTPRVEWLSFSGGLSDNVIAFAQEVHRFGFAYGRVEDDVWMARYVYGCLSGDALEWFEHLDPEIKEDWSKLRPIMIEKFKQSRLVRIHGRSFTSLLKYGHLLHLSPTDSFSPHRASASRS
ncbi:hypothetical protein FRB93_007081 [Tulasnella sp. JGI-2019a]|nr:hypothetical protein FRB93_007081 [Tulasnella sp. JGI-2019a]